MEIKNKTILIVGGTSGIGRATALKLAKGGAFIVIAGRSRERGQDICAEIESLGSKATFFRTDISLKVDVIALLEDISRLNRHVDVAINTASSDAGSGQSIRETQDVDFDHLIEVNLKGIWLCTKYQVKHMREHAGGSIINVLPVNPLTGMYHASVFASTKSAILAMTNSIALEESDKKLNLYTLVGDHFPTKTIRDLYDTDLPLKGTYILPDRMDDTPPMNSEELAGKILTFLHDMEQFPSGSYFLAPGT